MATKPTLTIGHIKIADHLVWGVSKHKDKKGEAIRTDEGGEVDEK